MTIQVELSQAFASHADGKTKIRMELPEGSQVRDAVFCLQIPLSDAKTLVHNGKIAKPTDALADGSVLIIAPEIPLDSNNQKS